MSKKKKGWKTGITITTIFLGCFFMQNKITVNACNIFEEFREKYQLYQKNIETPDSEKMPREIILRLETVAKQPELLDHCSPEDRTTILKCSQILLQMRKFQNLKHSVKIKQEEEAIQKYNDLIEKIVDENSLADALHLMNEEIFIGAFSKGSYPRSAYNEIFKELPNVSDGPATEKIILFLQQIAPGSKIMSRSHENSNWSFSNVTFGENYEDLARLLNALIDGNIENLKKNLKNSVRLYFDYLYQKAPVYSSDYKTFLTNICKMVGYGILPSIRNSYPLFSHRTMDEVLANCEGLVKDAYEEIIQNSAILANDDKVKKILIQKLREIDTVSNFHVSNPLYQFDFTSDNYFQTRIEFKKNPYRVFYIPDEQQIKYGGNYEQVTKEVQLEATFAKTSYCQISTNQPWINISLANILYYLGVIKGTPIASDLNMNQEEAFEWLVMDTVAHEYGHALDSLCGTLSSCSSSICSPEQKAKIIQLKEKLKYYLITSYKKIYGTISLRNTNMKRCPDEIFADFCAVNVLKKVADRKYSNDMLKKAKIVMTTPLAVDFGRIVSSDNYCKGDDDGHPPACVGHDIALSVNSWYKEYAALLQTPYTKSDLIASDADFEVLEF